MSSARQRSLLSSVLGLIAMLGLEAAHAHAEFRGSVPDADATLDATPQEIVLNFSRAVTPVTVSLLDAGGVQVESVGDVAVRDNSVVLPIVKALSAGNYHVRFRVLSGDAHTISSEFQFTLRSPTPVDKEDTVESEFEPTRDPVIELPSQVDNQPFLSTSFVERALRVVFMALLLSVVGFIIFSYTIRLPDTLDAWLVTVTRYTAVAGSLAAVVYFAVATLAISGLDAFRIEHLYVVLRASLGLSLLLALAGFLAVAFSKSARQLGAGAGTAFLLISRVVTGHPASQEPMFVLVPSMAVHVAAAGFWFASLWVLLRLLRKGPLAKAPRVLDDFARIALWSVAALIVAGVTMAVVHLESFDAVLNTEYGVTLLWKLAGVSALLFLAAINKFVITPKLVKSGYDVSALRASIRLEAAVMSAVILLSTILAATSTATSTEVTKSNTGRIEVPALLTDTKATPY